MADPDAVGRVYDEEEIGRIIERATELQHAEPAAAVTGGMTLAELEEIAAEAGIEPRYLRRAAMELHAHTPAPSLWARIVGERLEVVHEVVVPGELPDEGWERLVTTLDRSLREHGQPSLLGRTLIWRAESAYQMQTTQVTVSVRAGETHIRAEERLHYLASGVFGGSVTGVGVGIGVGVGVPIGINVLGSVLFAAAAPVGVVGLTYVGCRAIYRALVRRRSRVLADLVGRAAEEVRACIAEAAAEDHAAGAPAANPSVIPP